MNYTVSGDISAAVEKSKIGERFDGTVMGTGECVTITGPEEPSPSQKDLLRDTLHTRAVMDMRYLITANPDAAELTETIKRLLYIKKLTGSLPGENRMSITDTQCSTPELHDSADERIVTEPGAYVNGEWQSYTGDGAALHTDLVESARELGAQLYYLRAKLNDHDLSYSASVKKRKRRRMLREIQSIVKSLQHIDQILDYGVLPMLCNKVNNDGQ